MVERTNKRLQDKKTLQFRDAVLTTIVGRDKSGNQYNISCWSEGFQPPKVGDNFKVPITNITRLFRLAPFVYSVTINA